MRRRSGPASALVEAGVERRKIAQTNDKIEQVLVSCSRFMNPIWIKEYTLCVAVSGDHRGAAGNLLECPAYSLDAQTKARVVEDDYLIAMDIARGAERAEVIETCADNGSRPGCPAEDGARRNERQPGAKVAFSLADALLPRGDGA